MLLYKVRPWIGKESSSIISFDIVKQDKWGTHKKKSLSFYKHEEGMLRIICPNYKSLILCAIFIDCYMQYTEQPFSKAPMSLSTFLFVF
jgi:hypothetical protein